MDPAPDIRSGTRQNPVMEAGETDWEYAPVRIPAGTDRGVAATLLAMQGELGGWELARVRLHPDGTRRVMLRRRPRHRLLPHPVL
jgi:hypothetical protein